MKTVQEVGVYRLRILIRYMNTYIVYVMFKYIKSATVIFALSRCH